MHHNESDPIKKVHFSYVVNRGKKEIQSGQILYIYTNEYISGGESHVYRACIGNVPCVVKVHYSNSKEEVLCFFFNFVIC